MDEPRTTIPSPVEQLLERLAALGLPCPPHLTLQRYLRVLTESGLTERDAVQDLLRLYKQTTYGAADDQSGCYSFSIHYYPAVRFTLIQASPEAYQVEQTEECSINPVSSGKGFARIFRDWGFL